MADQKPPYIDPRVKPNVAASYANSLAERLKGSPKRAAEASIPIPNLATPWNENMAGKTMAEHAIAQRSPQVNPLMDPQYNLPQGFTPGVGHKLGANTETLALQMTDLLPEEAKNDPMFMSGHGDMFAINQPNKQALVDKYGIVRKGKFISAMELRSHNEKPRAEGQGLRDVTVAGLKALYDFNKQREEAENPVSDKKIEADAKTKIPEVSQVVAPKLDNSEIKTAINNMDAFDFDAFREALERDVINNEDQKKIIESRLEPLSLDELLMNGFVIQRVPIIPGKYEPIFRSYVGGEDMALKRMLMEERKNLELPDRYLLDKFSFMSIALGLHGIKMANDTIVFSDCYSNGELDPTKFWHKFNQVIRLGFHVLSSIGVNYLWFDIRVRKLLVATKNG